ncbi:branched-chain amino acid ABC transporter ATP-binding protein [Candidatus Caldarchaeum subterraneum]|uniref:Branched-chain amino acid ABC transporter ATP-binding protein n=1 Tax=Caldiarchaeum subterraneum TaxID=311458 RepID=E6N4M0_CALS0|nr:branched-chain amino acid ABC transporter ATP-binding protein [Candidatus Caldarchaeum subterraneum]BAJ50095.1 branched-chain amino acid ABC transporter ATP-binding protein [Candidatus Caldarchaeum subterraneum]
MPSLLQLEGLDSGYGDIQVLWNVSLTVEKGEVVAVLGPNGAGKTTLLKTIAGIIKPKKGKVLLEGKRIDGQPPEKIVEEGVALALAEKELFPLMTVHENLLLGAFNKRARQKLDENLEMVYSIFPKLKERASQKAGTMSGGEQQMLAIGRALMTDSKLLLLDEPSTGLAPLLVKTIFQALRKLMETKRELSILLVEQRTVQAAQLSDRGYVLSNGRIVYEGDIKEAVYSRTFLRKYMGM